MQPPHAQIDATACAVPAIADDVVCPHGHLHQSGPFLALDDEWTEYVRGVQQAHVIRLRALLALHREQP